MIQCRGPVLPLQPLPENTGPIPTDDAEAEVPPPPPPAILNESSGSSCETLTSSSDYESDSEEDDRGTVIVDGRLSKNSLQEWNRSSSGGDGNRNRGIKTSDPDKSCPRGSGVWNSGALLTLHSFGSEDKPIESEEWVDFLLKTMKVKYWLSISYSYSCVLA